MPDPDKVSTVNKLPVPRNVADIRAYVESSQESSRSTLTSSATGLAMTTQEVSHEYLELDILEDSAQSSRT